MSTDLNNLAISVIRTVVPVAVGNVITNAEVLLGIDLDNTALQVAAVAAVTGAWYTLVRVVAKQYPMVEWLLGWKATPEYQAPPAG